MRTHSFRPIATMLTTLSLAATLSTQAAAQESEDANQAAAVAMREVPPDATASTTKWYGWQTIIADAAALTFMGGTVMTVKDRTAPMGFFILGTGTYALGAPIVHWSQGEVGRGFASLGMRIALPTLVGLTANQMSRGCEGRNGWIDLCREGRTAVGILVGSVLAMVFDSAALAWKEVPRPRQEARILPSLDVNGGGAKVGLQGSF